jgi:NADH dehydrogenase
MLLLTGATGLVGSAVLCRLGAAGTPVRCLVRDPRRLSVPAETVVGDLADPASLRAAVRGASTVVHLAAAIRDQPGGATIEELNDRATRELVAAAEAAGVRRFVFFSALNATLTSRTRFLKAKARAERAVAAARLEHVVVAPSIIYGRDDAFMTLLRRMAVLPVVPVSGRGQAEFQPIWAEDVAGCVLAILDGKAPGRDRFTLAGPETLTYTDIVRTMLRAAGRPRRLVHVPTPVVAAALRATAAVLRARAPATWDEAELMEVSMTTPDGPADARLLGVEPQRMSSVLGA